MSKKHPGRWKLTKMGGTGETKWVDTYEEVREMCSGTTWIGEYYGVPT